MTPSTATVGSLLRSIAGILGASGIESPDVDAELLVGHVLGLGRGEVQAAAVTDRPVTDADSAAIAILAERRAHREPLQHILGRAAFRSLSLAVGPGVFVPRPETEQVVQFAIDALRSVPDPEPIGIDLGTGSGAIALAMATEVPNARIFAAENSVDAFIWARQNFTETAVPNATLVFDDLAGAFAELDGQASVVISNPPYVPDAAIPRDPEVRLFDPAAALYGGEDGLDVVRQLSQTAARLLRPGGTLVIEHGELQGEAIRGILTGDGWRAAATFRDLTQRDRTTTAIRG
ncbi:peptide chain release factor N(5)-glutamine methyltransferase [Mycetocola manganoxydans]|uniref:Release factor glutamine methyltransferase n=1 Tax=Mycetocola manganoxydans TaxID=699879 RepID=A0A3L7A3B2_9MICO|nr:peptide chain release factor N(5)-glutamine methyltransferase [Mycetocola manganoxydans]RLP73772.1 peptide chain release factor N(5)-glutamine methyltransferase [Mycetocola manganoxydans]GHD43155.1 release factor glutamine methyltransferase [Mycetocola manganoxydans]